MLPISIAKNSCRTCDGSGFVCCGRVMQHQIRSVRNGKPTVDVHVFRIRNICAECHGTGVALPRVTQHTSWRVALRYFFRRVAEAIT